jgi:MFS family permease
MKSEQRIYTPTFFKLCFSNFFFLASFNSLIPVLNPLMVRYGAEEFMGYTIAFFAFAALLCRPYSGKWVDVVGRKYVMVIGILVCVFLGFFYMLSAGLLSFLLLRFVHGFSAGFAPTGFTSYLSDIIPSHRRGEAMGILGMIVSSAFGLGPVLGSYIYSAFGENGVFIQSIIFALVGLVLAMGLPALAFKRKPFTKDLLKLKVSDLFEKRVKHPFHVMWLTIFAFGTILIVVPDHAKSLGFKDDAIILNKGIFFLCYVTSSIFVRFFAGKISDRIGREPVLLIGVSINIISLLLLAFCFDKITFMLSGLIFGISAGINSPTLFAWANDLAKPGKVGRAFSTIFIAIEIGIIAGSLCGGSIYQGKIENLQVAYFICVALSSASALLIINYIFKAGGAKAIKKNMPINIDQFN